MAQSDQDLPKNVPSLETGNSLISTSIRVILMLSKCRFTDLELGRTKLNNANYEQFVRIFYYHQRHSSKNIWKMYLEIINDGVKEMVSLVTIGYVDFCC